MSNSWINRIPPKIRGILGSKRDTPDLWVKDPETGQMVFKKDLEEAQWVFPQSGHHGRMSAQARLATFFDGAVYDRIAVPAVPVDPLRFRDERKYVDRLKTAKEDTGLDDAVLVGSGKLDGRPVTAAVQDFRFMGGSLGMAAGEAVITGMLHAVESRTPFVLFAASGGARMQEGILSLMQMPRTTIAVQRLREARLPYIVVLTDPTTGGVTASYAMLGDVQIAEPGALICFAGPRVIQQTIREQLPEGFQRAEYLLAHGMIDMVVHRHKLRETLARLCRLMMRPIEQAAEAGEHQHLNGHAGHGAGLNGAAADIRRAPGGSGKASAIDVEAVPVTGGDRFDPARVSTRDGGKRDPATQRPTKALPKDDVRG